MNKPGYKQTEVGLLPENWDVRSFDSLFTFSGGFSASRDQLSTEGHCYLHYGDIHKSAKSFIDVRAEYADIPKLNIPIERISPHSLLQNGDVVFVDASEDIEGVSKHIVVINKEGTPFISGLHTIVAKSRTGDLDNDYKRVCFQSRDIQRQFSFYAVGTKVSSVSKTNISKILLPLPPLPEQIEIARILMLWDEAIRDATRLINAKTRLKRALMQQLLTGKRRFPEFVCSDESRHTPFGNTPVDWPLISLKDIVNIVQRRNGDTTTRVLTASGHYGMVDQRTFFNRSVAGASIAGYYLLKQGEFAYNRSSMKGYPFGAIKRLDLHENGAVSTLYLCFALNRKDCDSDFLLYLFESGILNRQLRSLTQVGARAHGLLNITASDFFSMSVSLPSHEEQRRIAQTLNTVSQEVLLLENQLTSLQKQKRGLIQKLLTGQVRVEVPS